MIKKIMYLATGTISIILGILTIFYPDLALLLCSFALFIYGFSDLMRWLERRKSGTASLWTLLAAGLSLLLGICILIGSESLEFAASQIVLFFSLWLIASGAFEILGAVMYRRAMTSADLGVMAPGSRTAIAAGILMILVGLLSLLIPVFAEVTIHIWIVMGLILAGIHLIMTARSVGELEGNT